MEHRIRRRIAAGLVALLAAAGSVAGPGAALAEGNEAPGQRSLAARAIAASTVHTCVILANGDVKCWGANSAGQLGLGDATLRGDSQDDMGDNLVPVDLGSARTAVAISANSVITAGDEGHTCAVLDDGSVKCWGYGADGRLGSGGTVNLGDGNGEMGDNLAAVPLGGSADAVATGEHHTCARLGDGSVKCWGDNAEGQLGQGNEDDKGDGPGEMAALAPVQLGTDRSAIAIAAGAAHTCALLDNHQVKCWGDGLSGQLGYGDTQDKGDGPGEMGDALLPVDLGMGRTAEAIATGRLHTCALLDNDTVKCWGSGAQGRLGHGAATNLGDGAGEMGDSLPVVDLGTGVTPVALSPGGAHTCVLFADDSIRCWGFGADGALGNGPVGNVGDGPSEMGGSLSTTDPGFLPIAVTTGGVHSCAIGRTGAVRCWGNDDDGQLGQGNATSATLPPIALSSVNLGTGRAAVPVSLNVDVSGDVALIAGQTTVWTITVTNTGGRPLTGVRVRAARFQDCTQSLGDIEVGGSAMTGCTYDTTTSDVPWVENVVIATSDQGASAISNNERTLVGAQVFRPDAHIRRGTGAFAGDNVYNSTGANQTRAGTVGNLGTATFTLRLQNDGNVDEDFTVRGLGSTNRYTITYRNGATNVTAAVVAGTFTTNLLTPGSHQDLTLTIKAKAGTPVGTRIDRLVTVTSTSDTTKKDAVKATVTRR